MTNYEHFKGQIDPYMISVIEWGLADGKIRACEDAICSECEFNKKGPDGWYGSCIPKKLEWVGAEYKEPGTDWSKVPVDAKILVSIDGVNWDKRHFASYDGNYVHTFTNGGTSWSKSGQSETQWSYAKLAEEE